MIITLLQILLLCFVCYQDFRYRSVSVWYFGLLFVASLTQSIINNPMHAFFIFVSVNITFVLFLISAVITYFSLKNRKLTNIFDTYLGWGDIVFFVSLCFMFSPVNFVVFFIGSLFFSLLFSGFIRLLVNKYKFIPLAGMMAIFLIPVLTVSVVYNPICYSDGRLISLISKIL